MSRLDFVGTDKIDKVKGKKKKQAKEPWNKKQHCNLELRGMNLYAGDIKIDNVVQIQVNRDYMSGTTAEIKIVLQDEGSRVTPIYSIGQDAPIGFVGDGGRLVQTQLPFEENEETSESILGDED